MNTLNDLFQQPFVSRLGWTLIHFLWQGSAIALAFAAAQLALKRHSAQMRYLAGCVALAAMVAAFAVTFTVLSAHPTTSAIFAAPATSSASSGTAGQSLWNDPAPGWAVSSGGWADKTEAALPWLVLAWITGVISLSIHLFGGWLKIQRLRTEGVELREEPWGSKLRELKQRLAVSGPVRLLKSTLVEVPTVIGWLQPVILLPATVLTGLTPEQLESILAHELAHIRRNDYVVNFCQRLIETLLFYHPAVWWVSRCVRDEREHCCDDLVVQVCGDRMAYVRALASIESLRVTRTELAVAADGGSLLQRIRRLLGAEPGGGRIKFWRPLTLLTAVILIGLVVDQITAPTMYRGTAKILVRRVHEPPSLFLKGSAPDASGDPYWLQTELERLGSNEIMENTADRIGLDAKWCPPSEKSLEKAVDLLRQRVRILVPRQGNIITISIECANAGEARMILEEWFKSYAQNRASSGGTSDQVLTAYNDQLRAEERVLRAEVIAQERRLDDLKDSGEPAQIADLEMSLGDVKRRFERRREMRDKVEAAIDDQRLREILGSNISTAVLIDRHVSPVKWTLIKRLFR